MSTTAIIILLLFAFGASYTQRVTGFGFGIFIMTALPHLMPSYGEATALSGMLALVCTLATSFAMLKYVKWNKLLPILATFLVVSFFSVRMVASVDDKTLKHVLGFILICVSIYFFFAGDKVRMKPTVPLQVGMGTLSGLMGGFFAMQGPPAVVYFLSCTERKEEYMGLVCTYFVIGNAMMTVFRAGSGFVTGTVFKAWLLAVPAVLLGLFLGGKTYERMPIAAVRKCVYAFMAVAGTVAVFF